MLTEAGVRAAVRTAFAFEGADAGILPAVPLRKPFDFGFEPTGMIAAVFSYLTPRGDGANLCRYAAVPDYHRVVGDYLQKAADSLQKRFPEHHFRPFTDSSPVAEVYAAAAAGLGVIGKNGLLITPRWGSYVFIGCLVCDLVWDGRVGEPASCAGCGACESACPGKALSGGKLSQNRCLSALTQKKGALTPEETERIRKNGLVWGCDVCQTVCPMNADAQTTRIPEFLAGVKQTLTPEDLDGPLSDRAYSWRGTDVLRRNLAIFSAPADTIPAKADD